MKQAVTSVLVEVSSSSASIQLGGWMCKGRLTASVLKLENSQELSRWLW